MPGFEVLQGGIWSNIEDLGRYGYAHVGVTNSGAMDEYAYRWSQKLLGNKEGNAIEVMLGGLELKATADVTICVCGADLDFKINQHKKEMWQTYQVKKNDVLGFYGQVNGLRAYLAVKEGFQVQKKYSSYARMYKEEKLKKGDFIPFRPSKCKDTKRVSSFYIPTYNNTLTLHLLLGAQQHLFSQSTKETFFSTSYTLTPHMSPMGYKLQGKILVSNKGGIISEGIPFGTVQIPPDGEPIILLKERQTIGGYPKIGTVLASDCFALAQLPIGARIRFKEIHITDAQKMMKVFYGIFF
ncbi:MAG TPA: biotin-dependent carboxyltransferase [Sulfurovum sp.]|nr:biotin-dependent carboxyltransferase [Sulfurovum sp.]